MNIYHYHATLYLNGDSYVNVDGFVDSLEFNSVNDYSIIRDYLLLEAMERYKLVNSADDEYILGITSLTIVGKKK